MAGAIKNRKAGVMHLETEAVIHSLNGALDTVTIISHKDNNHCLAVYKGKICTAVWNQFSGYYYVDDVYGKMGEIRTDRRKQ